MSSRPEHLLARRGGAVEFLHVPALLMGAVTGVRNRMYDIGLLPTRRVNTPVVSVGNLTVGGTGKTPMVAWVVKALMARGWKPGVLSRGYHGDKHQAQDKNESSSGLNDEGQMFAAQFPGLLQVQNPNRVAGARELERLGADIIVLDDGFQHRRLGRDVDLVLVDATRPWGLPALNTSAPAVRAVLPRGLLRESIGNLGRASAVVITRSDSIESDDLVKLEQELQREAPGCVRLLGEHRPTALKRGAERMDPRELENRPVRLVSGIGNPEAFERSARGLGARIESVHAFPDHHAFTSAELEGLGGDAEFLVTSKDSVKLEHLGIPHLVLEVEFTLTRGEKVLNALFDALPHPSDSQDRQSVHLVQHG
jgi:tetraacyldisaccharide 4'-kinase